MPRYHLHLHDAHVDASDQEGHYLPSLEAARAKALDGIRELLGHEAMTGKLDFRGQIDVADEGGQVLETIYFKEAFEIIGL
jgi:hypothetical protein